MIRLPIGIGTDPPWPTCRVCESKRRREIFYGDGIEDGPSTISIDDLETAMENCVCSRRNSNKHGSKHLYAALFLATLPLTLAAPPPTRPTPSVTTPTTTTAPYLGINAVEYLTSVSLPTDLPTAVSAMPETALPYYLTQMDNGEWSKVDNAWLLYGRYARSHTEGIYVPDNATSTWAVEEALPPGWGVSSSRSSFYKTPLIIAGSVLLSLFIVCGIVFLALSRRKAHRKQKRRAERLRRKALAAAGLTEDDIDGDTAREAFNEKLAELEKQHRSRKNKRSGPSSMVRVKVKTWNQGLRRRKGGRQSPPVEIEVIQEEPPEEIKPVDSREDLEPTSSDTPSPTTSQSDESPATSATGTTQESSSSEVPQTTHTFFPPAYRPASIRSVDRPTAGPSTAAEPPQQPTEKLSVPGYYPAPATEDSEAALAVVTRNEGKSRHVPDEEEEAQDRMRHIATDDKRVLEQLRLGASAPPVAREEDESGPSAPRFEIDDQGFERMETIESPAQEEPSQTSPSSMLPAPPQAQRQRSFQYDASDLAVEPEPMFEEHLLPSAPPLPASEHEPSAPPLGEEDNPVPSAPPLALDEDDHTDNDGSTSSRPNTDTSEPHTISTADRPQPSSTDTQTQTPGETTRVVFLPKYEP